MVTQSKGPYTARKKAMLEFFGAKNARASTREARTKKELNEVLASAEYQHPTSIQVLEVFMETMDVPWRLSTQIDLISKRNAAAQKKQDEQSASTKVPTSPESL
ncbi:hypothetical protein LTR10_014693 [Elasticomyces elasticus]|uniref:Uncharacterized protein n=1 Tax=Exophiala sideris TaxID=1016849 RepID=A0ABR0J730_9EURO|nr:hypothetical protein LTR10_014693 [Elasticomyces elasticus]KAK5029338.1 hypothetical protein LTS07_005800 [Exophiala sideris]KAK5057968.1 hypothetical protein LTR69_006965 [Exophiala sideris]KAK5181927.1 hypothetical protein LTR44_005528 [Eurotiomycetes sp. CCFEE 6388]